MDGAVRGDAGYSETSALVWRHVLGERSHLIQRDHGELRSRTERPIGLCAVTPYSPTDPFRRYAVADLIHLAGTIAVGNDERIWHAVAEGVLTLLDIARVDPRGHDPDAHLAGRGTRVGHLANHQHLTSWPLFLVPNCPHLRASLRIATPKLSQLRAILRANNSFQQTAPR